MFLSSAADFQYNTPKCADIGVEAPRKGASGHCSDTQLSLPFCIYIAAFYLGPITLQDVTDGHTQRDGGWLAVAKNDIV